LPLLYEIERAPRVPATLKALPILILSVHSNCNCRCVMCDIWKRTSSLEMQTEDLARHRASMQKLGVQRVVLTGGEPLLHSDLHAFCTFFRDLNIHLTLLTTGLLLLKRAESVATLFDDVILSLDGPEPIHDRIRRVDGAFELIRRGILAVRGRNPKLKITCRTTVQKANHLHLRQTIAAARLLTLDSISFLAADVSSAAFNREQGWSSDRQNEIALTASELCALREEIDLLIRDNHDDIQSQFIVENPAKLRRIPERFNEYLNREIQPRAPLCNAPWVSAVVDVEGAVRPCFFHPPIGSLKLATLEEVLQGTSAQSFRRSLDVENNSVCRRCVCSLNYHPAAVSDAN
jgi:Fe-coproporphyrin III synthase